MYETLARFDVNIINCVLSPFLKMGHQFSTETLARETLTHYRTETLARETLTYYRPTPDCYCCTIRENSARR
jgi:hypothetical protein